MQFSRWFIRNSVKFPLFSIVFKGVLMHEIVSISYFSSSSKCQKKNIAKTLVRSPNQVISYTVLRAHLT